MKQVTIHSDGTGPGTVIVDENGTILENVYSATVHMEANKINEITLEVQHISLVVKGTVIDVVFNCPNCSEFIEHQCSKTLGGDPSLLKSQSPPATAS